LSPPILRQSFSDSTIVTFGNRSPKLMDINSVNFHELNDRNIKAEGDNQKTTLEVIGYRLWFDHYKKTYNDDTSNSLVNDKIRQDKTTEANLRKGRKRQ
jgi:hypothetical protein